jgi:hypothetical protein
MTSYENEQFEIQGELDDVVARLGNPSNDDDVDALIARRAVLGEKLRIVQVRASAAQNEAYQAGLQARREAFYADLKGPLEWLRSNLPRFRYELIKLAEMESRLEQEGTGRNWTDITGGLRLGGAADIQAAIARATRDSDWEEIWTPDALRQILDAARPLVAKHKAEKEAQRAARQAAFDHQLAEFEAGRGPDPRTVSFRIPVLG